MAFNEWASSLYANRKKKKNNMSMLCVLYNVHALWILESHRSIFSFLILLFSTLLIIIIWFCLLKGFLCTKSNLNSLEFNLKIILCKWNALASISEFVQSWFEPQPPQIWFINPLSISWCDFFSIVCLIECEIQWRTFNSGDLNWDYRTDFYCRCCCCWFCCSFAIA